MEITIRIPSPKALLRPGLRWALLPLLALALTLMWTHDSAPRASAGVPPGITIVKVDRVTSAALAGACYSVRDTSQVELFTVCDNDFQGPPDTSAVCSGGGVCSDLLNPNPGYIWVPVVAGTYHVVEIKPPPGYNLKPGKQVCVVVATQAGCSNTILEFQDDRGSQVNINKIAQYVPPKSCYKVFNPADQGHALFQVCDNNWQAPLGTSTVCIDAGTVCSDVDPALGSIRVNIIPADYHIEESKPPPNHTLDTAKYDCNATAAKCDITVIDRPIVRPWYPWDLTGSSGIPDGLVRVNDILDVVHHFFQDKPLPTPTP